MAQNTQELALVDNRSVGRVSILEPNNLAELNELGTLMAASGFFQDARGAAQACVKILAGREMGLPPIASMVGISIIDGKPATGANLLAACMKRSGYTWKVHQRDSKGCKITVSFRGEELGISEFTEDDAKRAELLHKKNWQKFPRSMYFARTISDAARTYAPEVLAGLPPYTAEELGAENTTEDGQLIIEHKAETREDVAARRIAEECAKLEAMQPAPSSAPPTTSLLPPAMRGAESVPPTALEPKPPASSDKPWTTFRGMLARFDEMKDLLGEDAHYAILKAHGVEHANAFKSGDKALACFAEMVAANTSAEVAA